MAKIEAVINTNYNSKAYSVKELQQVRRQMAKTANQRMVRLESHKSAVTGEAYTWGAHELAQEYLRNKGRRGRKGQLRYNENMTAYKTKAELQAEINELQAFLKARTSRYGEQKKIEKARIEKFESGKWGGAPGEDGERRKLKFASNKQFFDFLSSDLFKNLASAFTSEQVIELYDAATEKEKGDSDKVVNMMQNAYDNFIDGDISSGELSIREMEEIFGVEIT